MERFAPGMLARSLAGHDKGEVYLVIAVKDKAVFVSDGRYRPVTQPKKKNPKHLQPIRSMRLSEEAAKSNEQIKRIIKGYVKEDMNV